MRILSCLSALALLCGSPTQAATPTFDLFQKFCIDGHASAAQALAKANDAGWAPAPAEFVGWLHGIGDSRMLGDPAARMKTEASSTFVLTVLKSERGVAGEAVPTDVCGIALTPGDGADLRRDAAGYANVEPTANLVDRKTALAYAWRSQGSAHIPISAEDVRQGNAGPDSVILLVDGHDDAISVSLLVPSK